MSWLWQYSTNPHVAGIGVVDELLPWSRVAQYGCRIQCPCQWLDSGLCFRVLLECPFLFSLFSGLAISVNPAMNLLYYEHSPRKTLGWCLPVILRQFFTASSFSGSVVTADGETVWPKYRTSFFQNSCNFSGFNFKCVSRRLWNTFSRLSSFLEMCGQWQWRHPGILGRHRNTGL